MQERFRPGGLIRDRADRLADLTIASSRKRQGIGSTCVASRAAAWFKIGRHPSESRVAGMILVQSPFDSPVQGLTDGVWSALERSRTEANAADIGGPRGHAGVTGVSFRHSR